MDLTGGRAGSTGWRCADRAGLEILDAGRTKAWAGCIGCRPALLDAQADFAAGGLDAW